MFAMPFNPTSMMHSSVAIITREIASVRNFIPVTGVAAMRFLRYCEYALMASRWSKRKDWQRAELIPTETFEEFQSRIEALAQRARKELGYGGLTRGTDDLVRLERRQDDNAFRGKD
jgi:hypothetical protein